jgi:methylase of polypeptide subunit release factors
VDAEKQAEALHENPLSGEQMSLLVERSASKGPTTAFEVGCGSGSFSIALALVCPVQIVAFDTHSPSIDLAKKAAVSQVANGQIRFETRTLNFLQGRESILRYVLAPLMPTELCEKPSWRFVACFGREAV